MEAKLYCSPEMRPCFFFIFCLFIILTSFAPAISGMKAHYRPDNTNVTGPNDELIASICKVAPYYKLCVDVLKAGSRHEIVYEAGLVSIAIRSTIYRAMQTSMYVGRLAKANDNEPRYSAAYSACPFRHADVVGKLADWLHRVDDGTNLMAKRWVESAMDDIVACDKLFNQKGMVNALSAGNMQILRMCRNDIEILEHFGSHT